MRRAVIDRVWRVAEDRCEYCRVPQVAFRTPFQVDHIIAVQHGGTDEPENLALACFHCNRHKGPNVAGIDPATGLLTRLFHPRQDVWDEHFAWHGAAVSGRTDIGRTTIATLDMNSPLLVIVRDALRSEGLL